MPRRGFNQQDYQWFSEDSIAKLRVAQQEIQWLLDRNYKLNPILNLVGGHYQLSARQIIALKRATSTTLQYTRRSSTMLPYKEAKDKFLTIDGFNLIITLEVALSGSLLILGNDGVLRDLAGLRGTYKIIDQTTTALQLIGQSLQQLKVSRVRFLLDTPVSNSGRLKSKILDESTTWGIDVDVELVPNADTILSSLDHVITGDAIILDQCMGWLNLSRKIVEDYIPKAWVVSFK